MTENDTANASAMIERVGDLVAAYVSNNHIAAADLPVLIASVHAAVSGLTANSSSSEETHSTTEKATAAEVRKSVRSDGLVSFLDGKTYKTLKRHLTKHGLTPDTYRAQFGLPGDYPMVAASYSEKRASLAKSIGLGQLRGRAAPVAGPQPAPKKQTKAT